MLKEQSRNYGDILLTKELIGAGPHIRKGSPVKNAATIRTPVMMFHGTRDLNVEPRGSKCQSKVMESPLKRAR
jgi:dipeptidyl aminopeptidase/acylaminoacyl peptidase